MHKVCRNDIPFHSGADPGNSGIDLGGALTLEEGRISIDFRGGGEGARLAGGGTFSTSLLGQKHNFFSKFWGGAHPLVPLDPPLIKYRPISNPFYFTNFVYWTILLLYNIIYIIFFTRPIWCYYLYNKLIVYNNNHRGWRSSSLAADCLNCGVE